MRHHESIGYYHSKRINGRCPCVTLNDIVLVHDECFEFLASLVTRMLNVLPTQSALNRYLQGPWKLKNFPSYVL